VKLSPNGSFIVHYGLTPEGLLHDASMHSIARPVVEE